MIFKVSGELMEESMEAFVIYDLLNASGTLLPASCYYVSSFFWIMSFLGKDT